VSGNGGRTKSRLLLRSSNKLAVKASKGHHVVDPEISYYDGNAKNGKKSKF